MKNTNQSNLWTPIASWFQLPSIALCTVSDTLSFHSFGSEFSFVLLRDFHILDCGSATQNGLRLRKKMKTNPKTTSQLTLDIQQYMVNRKSKKKSKTGHQ